MNVDEVCIRLSRLLPGSDETWVEMKGLPEADGRWDRLTDCSTSNLNINLCVGNIYMSQE